MLILFYRDANELKLFNDIAPLCHENEFASSDWIFEDPKSNETITRSNASLVENIKNVNFYIYLFF